jgi:hypothetical protein
MEMKKLIITDIFDSWDMLYEMFPSILAAI